MMSMLGETKFDFVKPVKVCVAISCIIIALGLGVAVYRGNDFLDIDFMGGSAVQVNLREGTDLTLADMREQLGKEEVKKNLPDAEANGSSQRNCEVETIQNHYLQSGYQCRQGKGERTPCRKDSNL